MNKPLMPPEVAAVFDRFSSDAQTRLAQVRDLILTVAQNTPGVGPISETLKWGEPAYLTEKTQSGSTIRLGWKATDPDHCRVFFICSTNLMDSFRSLFPAELTYEGDRAIALKVMDEIPLEPLAICLKMALTYKLK